MSSIAPPRAQLEELAVRAMRASEAVGVVLFGSHASGRAAGGSDVDLALVFDSEQQMRPGVRRAQRALWPREVPLDLVPITVKSLREGGSLLAREIARTGVVLHGPRFF